MGWFALMAILLSAVGVHGVLAQTVAQRTSEIGIRLVLGAGPGTVLRMVVGEGLCLSLAGVGLGLLFALARILASHLYQVLGRDPTAFSAVGLALIVIACAAAYIPRPGAPAGWMRWSPSGASEPPPVSLRRQSRFDELRTRLSYKLSVGTRETLYRFRSTRAAPTWGGRCPAAVHVQQMGEPPRLRHQGRGLDLGGRHVDIP